MALQGKVALVTGATGIVGEGIARVFLEAGARVICPVRRHIAGSSPADALLALLGRGEEPAAATRSNTSGES